MNPGANHVDASRRLRIVYLLEDTPLFGGVKVVLQQANLLARRGHEVIVISPGDQPDWLTLEAEYRQTPGLDPADIPAADVTVASYWTTLARACAGASSEVAHYCQGFEGEYTHNRDEHPAIAEAYSRRVPALVVSGHLGAMLAERFDRPSRLVAQPLESWWRADRLRWRSRRPARILVTSPFEIDWKGVETSLRAVRALRDAGVDCRLIRLSQWPQSDAERRLLAADEFHCHLPPRDVPALVRGCDLLLAASWPQEGFGLPVLEAMASGVPVVASDIEAFRGFALPAARLVPHRAPEAFAAAAAELLGSVSAWRSARRQGLEIAQGYSPAEATRQAEAAMRWVATGAWRDERPAADER